MHPPIELEHVAQLSLFPDPSLDVLPAHLPLDRLVDIREIGLLAQDGKDLVVVASEQLFKLLLVLEEPVGDIRLAGVKRALYLGEIRFQLQLVDGKRLIREVILLVQLLGEFFVEPLLKRVEVVSQLLEIPHQLLLYIESHLLDELCRFLDIRVPLIT